MASKALPLLGFVLIVMLLVSAAVEAKDTTDKEKKTSVDQIGGYYPPWWPCRYRCCYWYPYFNGYRYRYRYYCQCCGRKEYVANKEKHH